MPLLDLSPADLAAPAGPTPGAVLARVARDGAVLLRGDHSTDDFVALSDGLVEPAPIGGAMADERELVAGDPTTTTVTTGTAGLPLHREASYAPGSPALLMFHCVRPAGSGGATMLCDGVALLDALPVPLRDMALRLRLRWELDLPPQRWAAFCGTTDPGRALAVVGEMRPYLLPWESLAARFTGDTLTVQYTTACAPPTLFTGEPALCNSMLVVGNRRGDYAEHRLRLGPVPPELLDAVTAAAADLAVPVAWQAGDILVVDNTRVMHGRPPFTDPGRRILVRMGQLRPEVAPA